MPADTSMMDDSYDEFPRIEEAFQQRLDQSLRPRGPSSLLDMLGELTDVGDAERLVDVGCGEGDDAIDIATRFGLDVIAIDPVDRQLQLGAAAAAEARLGGQVTFLNGRAEDLPVGDMSVDIVFAKESLMYADLERACAEAHRVLRPGGQGFVYQVFTGQHMSDAQAAAYWPMNAGARSVRPEDVERAVEAAGMTITGRVDIGSEWGEYGQENSGAAGRRLAHVARLRRDPERYITEFGQSAYDIMLHDCLWHVYRMLGFLHAAVFVFERP